MQRIAGMTVTVKAEGVPEAMYNGQRDRVVESVRQQMESRMQQMEFEHAKECECMQKELDAQRDRIEFQTHVSNNLRGQVLSLFNAQHKRRRGPIRRMKEEIALAWAYLWAFTMGEVWIDILLNLGMIERVED